MKFDIEKARSGKKVQMMDFFDDWHDIMERVSYIGFDIFGNIVYQLYDEIDENPIRTISPERIRMAPESKTWWFRTWVFEDGTPKVFSSEYEDGLEYHQDIRDDTGYWLEQPWSKEIINRESI